MWVQISDYRGLIGDLELHGVKSARFERLQRDRALGEFIEAGRRILVGSFQGQCVLRLTILGTRSNEFGGLNLSCRLIFHVWTVFRLIL